MKKARILSVTSIFLVYILLFCVSAYAQDNHFNKNSCVSNAAISYNGSATYAGYFSTAVQRWNNLGRVTIYYSPSNLTNLMIQNVSDANVTWLGLYTRPSGQMATIKYNNHILKNQSAQQIRGVYTHELGHALGLGDHRSDYYIGIMMYGYVGSYPENLKSHDISDYNSIH